MVKLIDCNQPIIKSRHTKQIDSKAKRGMRTHQYWIITVEESSQRFDLATVIRTRRITQIPLRLYLLVSPKTVL